MEKKGLVVPKVKHEMVDRQQLVSENREIAKQMWSGKLTPNEQRALNNLCIFYNLDPLQKQIVILGGNPYITKGGLLAIAGSRADKPLSIQVDPASEDERKGARVPEDSHYWKAKVYKLVDGKEGVFTEFGEANEKNVKLYGKDWKTIQDMAKTRAVNRALRNAYSIGLTSIEEMGYDNIVNTVASESPQKPAGEARLNDSSQDKGNIPPEPETPVKSNPGANSENEPDNFESNYTNNYNYEGRDPKVVKIDVQRQRTLWAVAKRHGWDETGLREYLKTAHGLFSIKDITLDKFDGIMYFIRSGAHE